MFSLEQAVSSWRHELAAAGIKSPELLAELEAHLRDDIKRQAQSGSSARQAFDSAVENLGKGPVLSNEFKKTDRARSVLEKLMLGISGVLVGFILFLSSVTIFLCYASWGERMVAFAAVISVLLVARGWSYAVRFLPVIADNRWRWTAGLSCIGTGFIVSNLFCAIILPYFEFKADHQLPAIGVWAVFLLAVFGCTGVGLLLSQDQRELCGMNRARPTPFVSRGD